MEIQSGQESGARRERPLVLIAEDMGVQVMLTRTWLHRSGYDTLEARDGDEALALCRSARPDLILLDVDMPARNGFQVLDELRRDSACQHIPVVMLTAHAKDETLFREWATDADAFMAKPFDPRNLMNTVERILQGRAALAET